VRLSIRIIPPHLERGLSRLPLELSPAE